MEQKKDNTEEKILNAAREVFVHKGMDGARMQEIANEAGINKALLHYYFRSKEKLFDAIFSKVIEFAFPGFANIISEETDFVTRLGKFIDAYFEMLLTHPFLPGFIIKELNRDPSGLFKLIAKYGFNPDFVLKEIEQAMDRGEIKRMDPRHLVINVISMCVFPFAVRPILNYLIFKDDQIAMSAFLCERPEVIKKFVIDSVAIKQ